MGSSDSQNESGSPSSPAAVHDKALVRAIADGDSGALRDLYDRYSGMLFAIVQRIVGTGADAEEILQQVFLQAWRQAGRYEAGRSSVSTWLVLIARSRAIDLLRTRKVRERTIQSAQQEKRELHASPEGVGNVLRTERRQRLRQELDKLPPEQREVLEAAFFRGMTQSEIAEESGVPLGTVKTRTLLAMKKLRTALSDEVRELL